jgi:hypothetical protein
VPRFLRKAGHAAGSGRTPIAGDLSADAGFGAENETEKLFCIAIIPNYG